MTGARYAVYLAPGADTPLWRFGSAFLGYDAAIGRDIPQVTLAGYSPEAIRAMTEDPRRYGFHMTLKAPFRLVETADPAALDSAIRGLAGTVSPFSIGLLTLECRMSGKGRGFVCLAPAQPSAALSELEARAVRELDAFRAPLTPEDRARRRADSLPPRERDYFEQFGYPFVFDAFRPHFSLTGSVPEPERVADALADAIAREMGAASYRCEDLVLFRQDGPDARFRIVERYPLGGRT